VSQNLNTLMIPYEESEEYLQAQRKTVLCEKLIKPKARLSKKDREDICMFLTGKQVDIAGAGRKPEIERNRRMAFEFLSLLRARPLDQALIKQELAIKYKIVTQYKQYKYADNTFSSALYKGLKSIEIIAIETLEVLSEADGFEFDDTRRRLISTSENILKESNQYRKNNEKHGKKKRTTLN